MTPRALPTTTAELRRDAAKNMLEVTLLEHVLDAARKLNWRTAHFRPAQTSQGWRTAVSGDGKGFPDLVLVNAQMGECLFVELKSERGDMTDEQKAWLAALRSAGQRAYVWTPSQWIQGHIQRVLEGVE